MSRKKYAPPVTANQIRVIDFGCPLCGQHHEPDVKGVRVCKKAGTPHDSAFTAEEYEVIQAKEAILLATNELYVDPSHERLAVVREGVLRLLEAIQEDAAFADGERWRAALRKLRRRE